jgi:hypothetical protein
LEAVDETAGSFVEGSVCRPGAFGAVDRIEPNDNIVGLGTFAICMDGPDFA